MTDPRPLATAVPPASVSRRAFLAWSAVVTLAACADGPTPSPSAALAPTPASPASDPPSPRSSPPPSRSPTPSTAVASPSPAIAGPSRRVLYRDAALADGRSGELQIGVSVLVDGGAIAWIRPADDEGDAGPRDGPEIVDASGATIVPGMRSEEHTSELQS